MTIDAMRGRVRRGPRPGGCFAAAVAACAAILAGGCFGNGNGGGPPDPSAGAPDAAPGGDVWFEEVAAASGLDFRHVNGHRDEHLIPEIVVGGAAWFDLDGDGDLDVYLVQSGRVRQDPVLNPPNQLFRNNGDGTFTDITESSGAGDRRYGMGVATGDYDGDGDVDLYITNFGPNVMLRNNGDGTLTDVTTATGAGDEKWGAGAAFVDYDADGDLDLYITNYIYWSTDVERECVNFLGQPDYCMPQAYEAPAHDTLYRNNGDGTFTDVSVEAGIRADAGNGLGVVCGDFNGDGLVDIYVANDGSKNILWVNRGDGTFRNEALLAGCAVDQDGREKAGMGVDAMDVDDDGDLDLLVVNLDNESDSFYRNQGDYFMEEAAAAGLASISRSFTRFGVAFIDFNNDGLLDLYEANGRVSMQEGPFASGGGGDAYAEPNLLIRGMPGGRFEEVLPRGGVAAPLIHTSRAAAFADFDDDGAVDILVNNIEGRPYLLHNVARPRGRWIGFAVIGAAGSPAIGATLTFYVGSRRVRRDVRTGYSYLAANDPRIHVGLGDAPAAAAATNVVVRWSDGRSERFDGAFPADAYHRLQRGRGAPIE